MKNSLDDILIFLGACRKYFDIPYIDAELMILFSWMKVSIFGPTNENK
jgi:hypothetical protein